MRFQVFFYRINKATDCFLKMKKRISTVAVPFVLWNVFYILEKKSLSYFPIFGRVLQKDYSSEFQTLHDGLSYLLIDPAAFHLWFLRDLIVFIALSPILYWCIKKIGWWACGIMLIVTPPIMTLFEFSHFDIAFFILGGTIALHSDLENINRFLSWPIVTVSALIYFSLSVIWDLCFPKEFSGEEYLSIFFSVCGMITWWRGYDWLTRHINLSNNRIILALTGYSFFTYLFHEPLLFAIMQIGILVCGCTNLSLTILYLANPFVVILISVCVAKIINILCPTFYSIIVGGRIAQHHE